MPNITGLNSALHDFSINRKESGSDLHINLSNVKKVDSIGLSVLLGLIFLGKRQPEKYSIKTTPSGFDDIDLLFKRLGFYRIIHTLSSNKNSEGTIDLIDYLQASYVDNDLISKSEGFQKIILFDPRLYPNNRQEVLNQYSSSLKEFMAFDEPRSFNHEQIIKTLIELAKNTYDHSDGLGFTGLNINKKNNLIQCIYCDTGKGICENIREYLRSIPNPELDPDKAGVADILYKAFEAGFTSKPENGINHGMGLPLVVYGAKGCGFDLTLRDANSLLDLSAMMDLDKFTHNKLRQIVYKTKLEKLLMFYFEREI